MEIREGLSQPALECIVSRMRLVYCGRISRLRPSALMAMLHTQFNGECLPWVREVGKDAELLRGHLPADFPSFADGPTAWLTLMKDEQQWRSLVMRISFFDSACDSTVATSAEGARNHPCHCGAAFVSQRALASHQRAKHHVTLQIQDLLPSAVCPCCHKNFRERVRLLAHVSNYRRPACRTWILQHCQPLDSVQAAKLREVDRMHRRLAQRSGHSHHLATTPVISAG